MLGRLQAVRFYRVKVGRVDAEAVHQRGGRIYRNLSMASIRRLFRVWDGNAYLSVECGDESRSAYWIKRGARH